MSSVDPFTYLHALDTKWHDENVNGSFSFRCREKAPGPFIGGPLVDKAVHSVFAALIWHSQELRDQLVLFGKWTYLYFVFYKFGRRQIIQSLLGIWKHYLLAILFFVVFCIGDCTISTNCCSMSLDDTYVFLFFSQQHTSGSCPRRRSRCLFNGRVSQAWLGMGY